MSGGAIEALQLGAGQVFIKEPWIDLSAGTISAELDLEPTPAFRASSPAQASSPSRPPASLPRTPRLTRSP